jgi:hypothetical protein
LTFSNLNSKHFYSLAKELLSYFLLLYLLLFLNFSTVKALRPSSKCVQERLYYYYYYYIKF